MPNPLLRVVQRPSKTPTDRPTPITPVLEEYAGDNHPYRGTEAHGVDDKYQPRHPDTVSFDAENPDGRAEFVPIEPYEKEPDPIPVKVVQQYKHELRTFATDRIIAKWNEPYQLLGRDTERTTVRIRNLHNTKVVWVGPEPSSLPMRGYPLWAGVEITLTTEQPIYVQAWGTSDADNCDVGYIAEYVRSE